MERSPLPAPIVQPLRAAVPVLLSVPHSGRDYPHWLTGNAIGGRPALESLEDPLVDRLIWRAVARGVGAVIARAPRAAIDCNRAADEIDPTVIADAGSEAVGVRARGGLGIVPSRCVPHGRLWRRPIDRAELERRVAEAHRPFHEAIAAEVEGMAAAHGHALLIDCHSMPSRLGQPQVVIGDRHGGSAVPWLAEQAARIARSSGWSVGLNDPYAGGFVVERHGRPDRRVHALQLEIDRSCYLARDLRGPGPGFDRAARLIEQLAFGLAEALAAPDALAAE
ncbi:MAG TPA: N-formylglutamate amidohydrolase [Kiloniellales bacterium]|nr:N-formylglutamate amidohydrolase [Kiloniellales bacterium]